MTSRHGAASVVVTVLLLGVGASAQQTPKFEARVDVVPVDVTVLDSRGKPIPDLAASDFTVLVAGQPRRVVSAQWIPLAGTLGQAAAPTLPDGFSSNERTADSRLVVMAIDQPNISGSTMRTLSATIDAFLDRLPASDLVAVVGFGQGSQGVPFTRDRELVKKAIASRRGQQQIIPERPASHGIGLSTALSINRRDRQGLVLLEQIVMRDCMESPTNPNAVDICRQEIESEAREIAATVTFEGDSTIRGLRALLTGLKQIDAPKALILISQGFFMDRQSDGLSRVLDLASLAAEAQTSIYGISMEGDPTNVTQRRASTAPFEDRIERRQGLETLTSASRGTLFNLAGTGAGVFERIEAELSGYYLLGIESDAGDNDGKAREIRIDVRRKDVTVRARRTVVGGPAPGAAPKSPRDAAAAALTLPVLLSNVPLRGIAIPFRGLEPSKIRMLIHADIGSDYTSPQRLSIAYVVTDSQGRVVDGRVTDARLAPSVPNVPSPLQFTAGASVDPGDYTVKIAVADGSRVGSLELPVHARLIEAGTTKVTELVAGGPLPPTDMFRPTVGSRIGYGALHGYFEAYGAEAASLKVRFEVAADDQGPAILGAEVEARPVSDDRTLFSHIIPVDTLPPGTYRLRAVISSGGAPLPTLTRIFEIAAPAEASAATTVASTSTASPGAPFYLSVESEALAPPFQLNEALQPAILQPFRERLAATTAPAFEEGVAQLRKRAYVDAEKSFKRAIRPDVDSTAALAYLAACFAAAGHDAEAASAWRTALLEGEDLPEIYAWLSGALLRTKVHGEARAILEEASARWPSDMRFARPLALLYAMGGQGRDAIRLMEKVIQENPEDPPSLFLVTEWLFNARRAGEIVYDRKQDAQRGRAYAERYLKTDGPGRPLVKQWLDYFDKENP